MKCPTIWRMKDLWAASRENMVSPDGKRWVPARPEYAIGIRARLRATWLVFTGRADAVVWPGGQ